MKRWAHYKQPGFTIVELLIVVVVIAILAAITIVAYNGIQNRATASSLKATLNGAAKKIELSRVDSSVATTSFPSGVSVSNGMVLSLSENGTSFCINGEITAKATRWHYDPTDGGLQEGSCAGPVIENSELGAAPNLITDTNFALVGGGGDQWGATIGGGTSINGTTRAGVSTDPYPARPVLRIVNTAAQPAASFSYIRGPVNETAITAGTTYTTSYYARLASGTHNSPLFHPGVMSGSATNGSIMQVSSGNAPTSEWKLFTRTTTPTVSGVAGTSLYIGFGLNDVKTSAFALEFQGFEIRAN